MIAAAASHHESGTSLIFVVIVLILLAVVAFLVYDAVTGFARYLRAKNSSDKGER